MLDGMSIRKKIDLDSKSGRLIGYVDFGCGQSPDDTDDAPSATDALVLMAVGVAAPWKIPIGYFLDNGLSGEVLKGIITEAILLLAECNLEVVAVVCDALSSNVMMGKLFGCLIHETDLIQWHFIEDLQRFQEIEGLRAGNKLRRAHVEYYRQIMK
ncbi:hypothetical protein HPB47_017000, partial [Ixodes persulcatus]